MMSRLVRTLSNLFGSTAALLALACVLCTPAFAQTPGGTTISNQASATYSDGTNSYSTISNTVTVTVSLVSGLTITPDAGANPSVVAGQTLVIYNFTVTNTGNFTDQDALNTLQVAWTITKVGSQTPLYSVPFHTATAFSDTISFQFTAAGFYTVAFSVKNADGVVITLSLGVAILQ